MKKKLLKTLSLIVALTGAMIVTSCAQKASDKSIVIQEDYSLSNDSTQQVTDTELTVLFRNNTGKNVRDIPGFFDNAALKTALTRLLGTDSLKMMQKNWQTQTPVQLIGADYVVGGMKDNSGSTPGFTIVYTPEKDNLSVAWTQNGKTTILQQKPQDINSVIQFPEQK